MEWQERIQFLNFAVDDKNSIERNLYAVLCHINTFRYEFVISNAEPDPIAPVLVGPPEVVLNAALFATVIL